MFEIKELEEIIREAERKKGDDVYHYIKEQCESLGISERFLRNYKNCVRKFYPVYHEDGTKEIKKLETEFFECDCNDCMWEREVEPYCKSLDKYGIKKFLFHSNWSGTMETMMLFTKQGWKVNGMTEITKTTYKVFDSDELETSPAVIFERV